MFLGFQIMNAATTKTTYSNPLPTDQ